MPVQEVNVQSSTKQLSVSPIALKWVSINPEVIFALPPLTLSGKGRIARAHQMATCRQAAVGRASALKQQNQSPDSLTLQPPTPPTSSPALQLATTLPCL